MNEEIKDLKAEKPVFMMTKTRLYTLFFFFYLLPFFTLFSLNSHPYFLVEIVLSSLLGVGGAYMVLKKWEEKMRQNVGRLVKTKLDHLLGITSIQNEGQQQAYEERIQNLNYQMEENTRNFEYKMDLLQACMAKNKEKVEELNHLLDKKNEEQRELYLQFTDLKTEYARLQEDFIQQQADSNKRIEHKESLMGEYQQTITEQRTIIEKKQRYISKLEVKVKDLMYEIRSLLQLEEPSPSTPFSPSNYIEISDQASLDDVMASYTGSLPITKSSAFDLSLQLQRYIEMAHNFTGAEHLGYVGGKSPRFLDLSGDSYAIDLRRLFDSFREETSGIIFIYSLKEDKLLFVNNFIKNLLGWSPEKFIKDFPRLIELGYREWRQTLSKVLSVKETQLRLTIKSKNGNDLLFQCFLGMITQGPFMNHMIGLLTPIDA